MVWSLCNQEGCLGQMHCPPLLLGSTILHHYSYGMQNLQIQCSDIYSFKLLVTKYYVLSLCKFPSFVNVSPGISWRVTLELTWSSWKSLILYIRETKCLKWWLKIKITTIVSTLLEKTMKLTSVIELRYVGRTGLLDHCLRVCGRPAEEPVPHRGAARGELTRGTWLWAQWTRVLIVHLAQTLNIVQTVCLVNKLPAMSLLSHLIKLLSLKHSNWLQLYKYFQSYLREAFI